MNAALDRPRVHATEQVARPRFTGQGAWPIVLVALLPAVLWLAEGTLAIRFGHPAGALRTLGILAALTGIAVFATNLVLGARLAFVERQLGGLDRVYRVHRLLGRAALLLVAAHVLFMVSSLAVFSLAAALALLTPAAGWTTFVGVLAFVTLVLTVCTPLVVKLRHETFVRLHRWVGLSFVLASVHLFFGPAVQSHSPLLTAFLATLVGAGTLAFAYRTVLGRFLVKRYRYRVVAVNPLTPAVVEIVLAALDERIRFRPGQFVFVSFADPSVPFEPHPFSITSGDDDPHLRIVVKALGDFTRQVQRLRPGALATVEGPYGGFSHLRTQNRRQIWIAGGIGVTPFLSMARSLEADDYEIDFYYCTERIDDAHFVDELYALSDQRPRVRVIALHRPWFPFITAEDVRVASRDLPEKDIFICGPPAMLRALSSQFLALGVPRSQIHFEDFGALSV